MNINEAIEVAKPLFDSHKGVDVLYITSDKQAFFADHHATNHARETIKDKVIFKVSRDEAKEPVQIEHTHNEVLGILQNNISVLNAGQLEASDKLQKAVTDEEKAVAQSELDNVNADIDATHNNIELHGKGESKIVESKAETIVEDVIPGLTKAVEDAESNMKVKEAAIEGTSGIVKTNATKAFNKAKAIYDAAKASLELKLAELDEANTASE